MAPDEISPTDYRARQLGKTMYLGFAKPDGVPDHEEVVEQIRKAKKKPKRGKCRRHKQVNCRHPAC